jgi:conjugative relaxase-like TrwC/TraI family protein
LVASFAVMQSPSYYTRQSVAEYYTGSEAAGVWLRGHESLGIAADDAVTATDFDRICAGIDASGKPLIKVAPDRMLGVDVTLSSPKSVSDLWAVGNERWRWTIAQAERKSVEAVLRLIEREIPLARRGHAGARREQASFTAAVFTHSESRPEVHDDGAIFPDPQRHHHLCIPNIAQRNDGSWGGVDSVALRSWKKTLGSIYRLELASQLIAQGFAIEREEDDWKWAVAGVPERISKYFSARRAALEETLSNASQTSAAAPALAAAINRTERRAKMDLGDRELTARWHASVKSLGFEPDMVVPSALAAGAKMQMSAECAADIRADRLAAVPDALTRTAATFARRDLIAAAANAMVGASGTLDDVLAVADKFVADGHILQLLETRDGPVYSTRQMLAIERDLVDLVRRGANTYVSRPNQAAVETLIESSKLNAEQGQVVRTAAAGKRLTLVQGAAGTGKSTTLRAVSAAWQSVGYTVLGASVAWRAANSLGEDLGIESRAIDAWLKTIEHGNTPFPDKTCVLIEEGGLQSSPQALRLLQAIDHAGNNSVAVMIGDEDQLRPVGPGHAMRLIREAIGATNIRTVVRQREEWARRAPVAFACGNARQALDTFVDHGLVNFQDTPRATVEALADRRQQLVDTAPNQSVVVIAKTNAEVRTVSAAIRSRLRERGTIVGEDVAIEATDASGNRHTLRLAVGDHVRFLRRNDELGVVNGSEARIVALDMQKDGTARLEAEENGRYFAFTTTDIADSKGRARLAHAYAATIFQSQGATVERALVLLSASLDRRDAYVASSRARETTEFFVDAKTLDRELNQIEQEPTPDRAEARLSFLAQRLSRASVKTNALDLLVGQSQERTKSREFSHEL